MLFGFVISSVIKSSLGALGKKSLEQLLKENIITRMNKMTINEHNVFFDIFMMKLPSMVNDDFIAN